jgi:hypothetical protein
MKVKVLVGISYPKLQTVRNRLRNGENLSMEDRGEWVELEIGDEVDAPADLLKSWLSRGYVEELESDGD